MPTFIFLAILSEFVLLAFLFFLDFLEGIDF